MLLDQERNDAYRNALNRELKNSTPTSVLDIGAGCGLLSMMASQAGATKVIACEMSPALSRIGEEIVKLNKYENISFVNKDCRKVVIPRDQAERADLALFELFDCSLIGEGILHFLAYARERLLTDQARYLPMAGRIRAVIIEHRLDEILGIDVNLLNPYRFSPSFINVDSQKIRHRQLCEPFDVFSFDFSKATPEPVTILQTPRIPTMVGYGGDVWVARRVSTPASSS